jgi:geranylgeranyl diphosphate synthase type I
MSQDELNSVLQQKSTIALQRFKEVATSGVKDEKLLAILEEVKRYWKDSFRPALTSLSCEAVGGQPDLAVEAGLMFSLASSGFGIHDDIIDNSTNKHLRHTIYGLHGRDSALLVGDLLIFKGWTIINEMIKKMPNSSNIAEIVKTYGGLSIEVCEAEFAESLCRKNIDISLDCYQEMQWKAMAEVEACSRIGALIGNGKKVEIEALAEFGRRLGAISRLKDDIDDGKIVGNTFKYKQKYNAIKKILAKKQLSPFNAKTLLRICFETNAFAYVQDIAKKHEDLGLLELEKMGHNPAVDILLSMLKISYLRIAELCC